MKKRDDMQDAMIELIDKFGYIGVFFLIFIENIFPPIPSEGILLFGGYASYIGSLNIWLVIICATIGSMSGAVLLYFIGSILGKQRIKSLMSSRVGRILHLNPQSIDNADKWFQKYEGKAVFLCRCIPVVRSIVSIPAGISKMNFRNFILLTLAGSAIWNILIAWIGCLAGDTWQTVQMWLGVYSDAVLVIILILVLSAYIIVSVRSKNKSRANVEGSKKK